MKEKKSCHGRWKTWNHQRTVKEDPMGKDTFEVQKNWKIKNINFNYCNDQDKRVETSSDQ